MISSAVIVPEPEDISPTSPLHKRRQSADLYNDSFKRPRLEGQLHKDSDGYTVTPSATSPPRRKPSITGSGAVEERKRGQRLFGALLGTLSQSSTTTAQRRRADIEKKQLGKLQQRDEELEDEVRRKREKLDIARRKEEKLWEEQSTQLRHSNMLAQAHFLETRTEPTLFYRPWELRAEEEDRIKRQIQAAEKAVENEINEHQRGEEDKDNKNNEGQHPSFSASPIGGAQPPQQPGNEENATKQDGQPKAELVGADATNEEQATTESTVPEVDAVNYDDNTETQASVLEDEARKHEEKTSEDHGGEELVEGQEDDVIY
ncbi:hypothetical protein GJ744_002853 [Endocarpon pusillum]|uniref:Pinin/SDK/MemA protein domain-containing protein n=1 Tax=Endocarpon pusillum TaxID=364733 RepID=A0A8H7E0Z9_9EURO|nr:hypothetical protein GJ744_002853 [Endocarpon pusillum]